MKESLLYLPNTGQALLPLEDWRCICASSFIHKGAKAMSTAINRDIDGDSTLMVTPNEQVQKRIGSLRKIIVRRKVKL
jgi:hypothetical protein